MNFGLASVKTDIIRDAKEAYDHKSINVKK